MTEGGLINVALQNEVLVAMSTDKVKSELKRHTDRASQAGAFGAPDTIWHFHSQPEPVLIWGSDRFEVCCGVVVQL